MQSAFIVNADLFWYLRNGNLPQKNKKFFLYSKNPCMKMSGTKKKVI
jgi:hypothetical protein